MKKVTHLKKSDSLPSGLVNKINELADEVNRHKEEIRQLKSKLRINAHYQRVR